MTTGLCTSELFKTLQRGTDMKYLKTLLVVIACVGLTSSGFTSRAGALQIPRPQHERTFSSNTEFSPTLSGDGKTITFTDPKTGITRSINIKSHVPGSPWSAPDAPDSARTSVPQATKPEHERVFSANPEFSPTLSRDGQVITFTDPKTGITRATNIGKHKPTSPWSKPNAPDSASTSVPQPLDACGFGYVGQTCDRDSYWEALLCATLYWSQSCQKAVICYQWFGDCGPGCSFGGPECVNDCGDTWILN